VLAGAGYSITEAPVAGWGQTSATCDDGSPLADVDVAAGETVTCTFVNTKQPPTAARVGAFRAWVVPRGVRIGWRSRTEVGLLGYNLWSGAGEARRRLNPRLIPARASGSPAGATYFFLDRRPPARGRTYRLELVDLAGKSQWAAAAVTLP
jgi:hypothetical protein